jgi:hypothetical protein
MMMRRQQQGVRAMRNRELGKTAATSGLATVVLSIALLANALTVSATSTAETASVISVHTEGTVVPLPADSYTDVASLFLPKGTWLLVAKADFVNTDDASHSIKCRLVAGGQADITATGLTKEIEGPYRRTLFSVLPRHVESINGMLARWRCRSWQGQNGSVEARYIRLLAIKTGSLKSINLETNAVTSEGTGTPAMVSARIDGSIDAPVSGSPAVVASFHLPQGAWWVTAKAVARGADELSRSLSCDLTPSPDNRTVALDTPASLMSVQSVSWQSAFHASKKNGVPVRLRCESTATGAGQVTIDSIRITAVRAGSLAVLAPEESTDPQSAVVQINRVDGPIAEPGGDHPVKPGKWVGITTANFRNSGTVVWPRQCNSHVGSGPYDDLEVATATASHAGSLESAASTAVGTVGSQSLDNSVEFACPAVAGPSGADVRALFIRSVYLKTDSLSDTVF